MKKLPAFLFALLLAATAAAAAGAQRLRCRHGQGQRRVGSARRGDHWPLLTDALKMHSQHRKQGNVLPQERPK
jgi:hypothetical protein